MVQCLLNEQPTYDTFLTYIFQIRYPIQNFKLVPKSLTNFNLNQTKNTFTEQSIFSQNCAFLGLFLGITPMNKIHILEFHY
ncbi:hypothetical protein Gotur_034361 [Gossypium turneri]